LRLVPRTPAKLQRLRAASHGHPRKTGISLLAAQA
jgi:hypothetical protein